MAAIKDCFVDFAVLFLLHISDFLQQEAINSKITSRYACSTSLLSLSNQNYPFPISMTIIHLIIKFLLAWTIRGTLYCARKSPQVTFGWKNYLKSICPVGEIKREKEQRA